MNSNREIWYILFLFCCLVALFSARAAALARDGSGEGDPQQYCHIDPSEPDSIGRCVGERIAPFAVHSVSFKLFDTLQTLPVVTIIFKGDSGRKLDVPTTEEVYDKYIDAWQECGDSIVAVRPQLDRNLALLISDEGDLLGQGQDPHFFYDMDFLCSQDERQLHTLF